MSYQIIWRNYSTNEQKSYGLYPTEDEAYRALFKKWKEDNYHPYYVREWEDFVKFKWGKKPMKAKVIDYGFHDSFYYIRRIK